MPIMSAPAEEFLEDSLLGLGIKEFHPNQRHCGIIYRPDENEVRFLHLAFHFDLRDEVLDGTYWWATCGLDEDNQLVLAAFASLLAAEDPAVPYGFDSEGLVFEADTGKLKAGPVGHGLTCATFVLAVFRTYGFEPLQVKSWQARAEDVQWQQTILQLMERNGASKDHVDAIRSSEPSQRFRPEEVVGGASQTSERWGFDYDATQVLAAQVLADMAA
ncbi:hypothetical protein ANTHELSMS3_01290 [Antarctobacter heliothermus]|uniref:Uncharacterized protein n=1 Tax=Antarctobacter heliothermus TaxID=74033 RepID=A0A222E212_9RHOB|nr:hypothetical protein [Antarctobacter heliothermus]ASP20001.1 hypothetical protein ANTHELSMS3_01290 [Antarctobacter heliothermus]